MHLTELNLQGFKTFAVKTTLRFLPPKDGRFPVTSVVGPNGSGKSNVADAIRWVLGEQSLKLLRGKRSEDIIFSGSEGRGRSGFAEVSLTLDNQDHAMPIEYGEVTITRRLYRDGESEYLLNDAPARLADIQLLLAESGVGTRSYSVIGQGMIDHILVSSPEERKAFFDDATGVRPLQIKRHEAMLKLKRTCENLAEVELLLNEIEPRLKSLKRQVSRLEQREEVERALVDASSSYYGSLWWKVEDQLAETRGRQKGLDAEVNAAKAGLKGLEARVDEIEREEASKETQDDGLLALQKKYQELQKRRTTLRDERFETQKEMELAKVRAQSNWAPLPLSKIISELDSLVADQTGLLKRVKEIKDLAELRELEQGIDGVLDRSSKLVGRLQRPAPEDQKADPALMKKLFELDEDSKAVDAELAALEKEMLSSAKSEKQVRTELIDLQRELRAKQSQLHLLENQRNGINIELARLEERRGNLSREMDEQMKEHAAAVRQNRPTAFADTDALYPEIQRLRYKLELIGGIDPEIVKEYEDTNARFEFLDGQVKDLQGAIEGTEKIVDELDEQIRDQSEKAFRSINEEFQKYFKVLFGGGSCALVKLTREDVKAEEMEEGVTPERVSKDTVADEREEHEQDSAAAEVKSRLKEREDRVVGIDIQATPPGKKLKALNLLSGGERALTSIALVCAIMSVNPAPFVLLDEVDAALDEANTFRFAAILETLSKHSQFIVITHNRATMEKADVLYGVTMNDDGVSNLLSVKLEDVADGGTARR
jgi:chromosome segregation ATPase